MKALKLVRELAKRSQTELQTASKLADNKKVMGLAAGGVFSGAAAYNLVEGYDNPIESTYAPILFGLTGIAAILSFKKAADMSQLQKAINIASKFSKTA